MTTTFAPPLRCYTATTVRILRQLRADRRTVAMLVLVPTLLLTLVYFVYHDEPSLPGMPSLFDRIGVSLLGILPFIVMFLITAIAMQRERTSGTLERLMTTPLSKLDLLAGYGSAFSVAATAQAGLACLVAFWLLGMKSAGSVWLVLLIAVLDAVLGVALGLLASAFARTEFQAVQFMPVVVIPQILLCGLFLARDQMNSVLEAIANVLPLSYMVDALQQIAANPEATSVMWNDVAVGVGFVVVGLVLASLTLRRKTA
jgi:ABC-2 type transport system permease protein